MMKIGFVLTMVLLFATSLTAGPILGNLTEGGKPIAEGTEVAVDCGGQVSGGKTDKQGSYRVSIPKEGRCTLTVTHKGQKPTATVASLDEPVTADFDLQVQDGKYKLVRR